MDLPEVNEEALEALGEISISDAIWAKDIAKWDFHSLSLKDSAKAEEIYNKLIIEACKRFPREKK